MTAEPISVTLLVVDAFERLDIPYLIGGSLASALHGTARSTLDTGLVAEMRSEQVYPFVEMLQKDFYVDDEMINDAIRRQSAQSPGRAVRPGLSSKMGGGADGG